MGSEWRTGGIGVGKEHVPNCATFRGKVSHRLYLQALRLLGRIFLGILGA